MIDVLYDSVEEFARDFNENGYIDDPESLGEGVWLGSIYRFNKLDNEYADRLAEIALDPDYDQNQLIHTARAFDRNLNVGEYSKIVNLGQEESDRASIDDISPIPESQISGESLDLENTR